MHRCCSLSGRSGHDSGSEYCTIQYMGGPRLCCESVKQASEIKNFTVRTYYSTRTRVRLRTYPVPDLNFRLAKHTGKRRFRFAMPFSVSPRTCHLAAAAFVVMSCLQVGRVTGGAFECNQECATPDDTSLIRRCPGDSSKFRYCPVPSWKGASDAVALDLAAFLNISGVQATGNCAKGLQVLSCAARLPVCEMDRHSQRVCEADCVPFLSEKCRGTVNASLVGGICAYLKPAMSDDASSCFKIPYSGPRVWQWVVGFLLCLIFAALSSLALNLQKKSLNEADKKDPPTPLCKQWKWILGMVILIIGSIVDFIAYGLAPQSVLTPLAGMVLVWNVLISRIFGEKSGIREYVSTVIIFAGTLLSVIFASHYTPNYTADEIVALYREPAMIAYLVLAPIFAASHYGLIKIISFYRLADPRSGRSWVWQTLECVGYAGTAGTIGAQAVLFAKQFMELIKASALGDAVWTRFEIYLIALCIPVFLVGNITFLNAGLRHYSALQTIPIYQTYWMLVATASGLIFFKEIEEMSEMAIGFFWLGVMTSIIGIIILSGRRPQRIMTKAERRELRMSKGSDDLKDGDFDDTEEGDMIPLNPFADSSYRSVAFNDVLDASARYSVGDVMIDRGYVPTNGLIRDVFIRPQTERSFFGGHTNLGESPDGESDLDDVDGSANFRTLGERTEYTLMKRGRARKRNGSFDGTKQAEERDFSAPAEEPSKSSDVSFDL